uniref:Uncharacterized protein n=1 Tax=Hyaloperonospora arabidopsidis (strain Emoy2) TaxID=559515 RepID=M4BIV1_HYAAE
MSKLATSTASARLPARTQFFNIRNNLLSKCTSRSSFHFICLGKMQKFFRMHKVVGAMRLVLRQKDHRQVWRCVPHNIVENLLLTTTSHVGYCHKVKVVPLATSACFSFLL